MESLSQARDYTLGEWIRWMNVHVAFSQMK